MIGSCRACGYAWTTSGAICICPACHSLEVDEVEPRHAIAEVTGGSPRLHLLAASESGQALPYLRSHISKGA